MKVGPKPVTGVLIRGNTNTERHKGKCHVMTEAKIGVMHIQVRELHGLLAPTKNEREVRRILP